MKQSFLILMIFILTAIPAAAKTLNRVAAVVNNEIITTYQLDQALKEALANNSERNQLTSAQFDQLEEQVLKQLISERLVEQRIKDLGLEVGEPELNAAIEDVQRKNNLTRPQLEQALAAQGMTMEAYRAKITKEILRYKLINREVNYKILVTSGEVRDYFREHIEDYRVQPKIHVRHITYDLPPQENIQERETVTKQAEITRQLLLDGEDFEEVLTGQADVASGNDMGEVVESDLAPGLQEILSDLDEGQVSEPIQINSQIHLFQVMKRNPGDIHLFDRVKSEIEETLRQQKSEARYQQWEKEVFDQAHIDIRI